MLLEDVRSTNDPYSLLPALVCGFHLDLGDLVAQKRGVFVVSQVLEAWGVSETQFEQFGKVLVVLAEEPERFGGHQSTSLSMAVSDSTPGQWWILSTRWLETGLAMA